MDHIKMDHEEIGYKDVDWAPLSQNEVQWRVRLNTVMNLRFTSKVGNFGLSASQEGLHGVG